MNTYNNRIIFLLLLLLTGLQLEAQLSLTAQIRPRFEVRNGFGTLPLKGSTPAAFMSQRSRLAINYASPKLVLRYALQDVRLWGQDASTISNADGNRLGTHEAWAELILADAKDSSGSSAVDMFSIRVGRQELVYDDQRLLGNLDWLQQGRRHDALVFKLMDGGWQADLGLAFNQHTDAFAYNGTAYTPANVSAYVKDSRGNVAATPAGMIPLTNSAGLSAKNGNPALTNMPSTNGLNQAYKSMQFIYGSKKIREAKISALVFADHFGRYKNDSVRNISGTDTGYIYGRKFNAGGVHSRITTGVQVNYPLNAKKGLHLNAGAWYQGGKDRDGLSLSAFMTTASLNYSRKQFSYTAGWDMLSGNDALNNEGRSHRFDPLYGTPHKFWGQMDYFYAGTGSPAGGLNNIYLKSKYAGAGKRFSASLDYHWFALLGRQFDKQGASLRKYLGSEIDFVTTYSVNKYASVEWGLALMAAGKSMAYAKGIDPANARNTASWSNLTLHIKPEHIFK
ncbi:alginate export family protein [Flavihumibacter sediminis]|nr:alginate export family protein [Flavihumibacter sediminis]